MANKSFGITGGAFTAEENAYLIEKGLKLQDSNGDMMDISTDTEDVNLSNLSILSRSGLGSASLLLFEDNEHICEELKMDKSVGNDDGAVVEDVDDEEDKENVFYGFQSRASMSPSIRRVGSNGPGSRPAKLEDKTEANFDHISDAAETSNKLLIQTFDTEEEDPEHETVPSTKNASVVTESLAENEEDDVLVPCTQHANVSFGTESLAENEEGDVLAPCTQYEDVSVVTESLAEDEDVLVPCTQHYGSISTLDSMQELEPNLDDSVDGVEIVPCTQQLSGSYISMTSVNLNDDSDCGEIIPACNTQQQQMCELVATNDASSLDADVSSVPCSQSQTSVGGHSSKEDLDDTLTMMTKLLALADEQEARELLEKVDETTDECKDNGSFEEPSTAPPRKQQDQVAVSGNNDSASLSQPEKKEEVCFKTPLKHVRLQQLKNKKLCTPSPPRSYVNTLLQRNALKKVANIGTNRLQNPQTEDSAEAPQTYSTSTPGLTTSTPKRTPLTNITPLKKTGGSTPRSNKTSVMAKVDSGLRRSPFPEGLSPVGKYIYLQPPPSPFTRVHGSQKVTGTTHLPSSTTSSQKPNKSMTKIPVPPSRVSQAHQQKPKTPTSFRGHTPLKTSTYFNMTTTPPQILKNERKDEKKPFLPALQYTGSSKLKDVHGEVKMGSPNTNAKYCAQRHLGFRDDSGNASFIQNTSIQKRNIPQQSKLMAPHFFSQK